VLEAAATKNGLPGVTLAEPGLEAKAASDLGLSPAALKARLAAFGQSVGRPWRADERAAAMAAWLALGLRPRPDRAGQ
jgi:hypothetical protein